MKVDLQIIKSGAGLVELRALDLAIIALGGKIVFDWLKNRKNGNGKHSPQNTSHLVTKDLCDSHHYGVRIEQKSQGKQIDEIKINCKEIGEDIKTLLSRRRND